jgi:hypothetical protein
MSFRQSLFSLAVAGGIAWPTRCLSTELMELAEQCLRLRVMPAKATGGTPPLHERRAQGAAGAAGATVFRSPGIRGDEPHSHREDSQLVNKLRSSLEIVMPLRRSKRSSSAWNK